MIERRARSIPLRIHQNKLRSRRSDLAVPEAIGLLNPVGVYIRHVNKAPQQITGKKTLGPLVVFDRSLGICKRDVQKERDGEEGNGSPADPPSTIANHLASNALDFKPGQFDVS